MRRTFVARWITRDWPLKLVSLVLALVLWLLLVPAEKVSSEKSLAIPLETRNVPAGLEIVERPVGPVVNDGPGAESIPDAGKAGQCRLDENIYFCPADPHWADKHFEEQRQHGVEQGSRQVDPQFAAAEKGDFRLPPDSPAIELGFEPIQPWKANRSVFPFSE